MKKILDFISDKKAFFIAGLSLIAIILILVFWTQYSTKDSTPEAGVYHNYKTIETTNLKPVDTSSEKVSKKDQQNELAVLINDYYDAYAKGDTTTIQTIATPIADAEISYIEFYSQYIDSFDNIKLYTKRGLDDDSFIVSAYVEIQFTGVKTKAAGLDFFYVRTNESGRLFIDNLYSSFNQSNSSYELDPEVSALIVTYEQQPDVIALQNEVQSKCNEALANDSALDVFVNTTLQSAIVDWATQYKLDVAEAERVAAEAAAAAEAEAKKLAEEAAAAEIAAAEEANKYEGKTNSKVNVRAEASEKGSKVGMLDAKVTVTIYSKENNWYKIDYNGQKAYVREDFITTSGPSNQSSTTSNTDTTATTTTTATSSSSYAAGDTITLKDTTNIREKESTDSAKVGVASAGEKITVVSVGDTWTKVKYKSKEGYIRNDVLPKKN